MKKGFTLIELLIVMVLVGVLVTVALPKYYASMERGRAMEGINNLRAASDYVNARYVMNGNSYSDFSSYRDSTGALRGDFTKAVSFTAPKIDSAANDTLYISVTRESGEYTLKALNSNGELTRMFCIPSGGTDENKKLCENLGFELSSGDYVMQMY